MTPSVTVFVARGCGACTVYKAAFAPVARAYARRVRVFVIETTTREGANAATRARINATPTTLVQTRRGTHYRRVGALDAAGVRQLFESALR
jgi:hypothetical protein